MRIAKRNSLGATGIEIESGYWLNQTTGELRKTDGTTVGYYSSIADAKADIKLLEKDSGGITDAEIANLISHSIDKFLDYDLAVKKVKAGDFSNIQPQYRPPPGMFPEKASSFTTYAVIGGAVIIVGLLLLVALKK